MRCRIEFTEGTNPEKALREVERMEVAINEIRSALFALSALGITVTEEESATDGGQ